MPSDQAPFEMSALANRFGLALMRFLFAGYFFYLTVLLLSPNPYIWVGSSDANSFLARLYPYAHLISFTLLTLFARFGCQPLPRWLICGSLIAYATATELLQRLIPPRTAEWRDWFQDLAGIAVGMAAAWMLARCWKAWRGPIVQDLCSADGRPVPKILARSPLSDRFLRSNRPDGGDEQAAEKLFPLYSESD